MAFPDDYTLLGTLKLPTVTGTSTSVPLRIKFEDFTSEMLSKIDSDGGDFRLSDDEFGNNQLALDIVSFTKSSGGIEAWYLEPSVVTDQLVHVWGDNSGDTKEGDTATYGKHAVYAGDLFRSHDGGATESSNSYTMADDGSGSVTAGNTTGTAAVTAPRKRPTDVSVGDTVGNYTLSNWVNGTNSGTFLCRRDGSTNSYQTGISSGKYFYNAGNGFFELSPTQIGWHKIEYVVTGTSVQLFIDGQASGTSVTVTKSSESSIPLRIGYRGNGGIGSFEFAYPDLIGESSILNSAKSADQAAVEYFNQNTSGAWFTATNASTSSETLYSLNITSAYLQRTETQIPIISAYKELLESAVNIPSKYLERSVDTFNIASSYKQRDVSSLSLESAYQQREQSPLNIISSYQERLNESLSITTKYNGSNVVIRLDNAQKFIEIAKSAPFSGVITYADGTTATFSRIASTISRIFTPLLGSGSQRYEVDTPPSFAGDFEWEIKIAGAPQNDKKLMTIQDSSGKILNLGSINFGSQNKARLFSNTGVGFVGNIVFLNNKLNKINLKYVASTEVLTFSVNGVVDVTSGSISASDLPDMTNITKFKVGVEASNNGGGFTGFFSDFKVTNGSTLVIDSPLDRQYTSAAPSVINKVAGGTGLTAVNLNNAGQAFTLNAAGTIYTGADGTTTIEVA